jgi:glycosyltransferase involved in cell wall biosynthesis
MGERVRLAYLVSHPIQYQVPLLRRVAKEPDISFKVLYCSDLSLGAFHDPEFGRKIEWDVPLLDGYEHEFLPVRQITGKPGGFGRFVYGIKDAFRRGGYDILWVHGWGHWSHIQAIRAARQLGIRVFVRGEANLHLSQGGPIKRRVKRIFLRWLFSKVDGFLAIGSWNREFYLNYGVDPGRIHMMPYAVDNDFFKAKTAAASQAAAQLRMALGIAHDRPVILYASKLTERKRAFDLLDAYVNLSPDGKQEPGPCLLFVGDGEMSAALKDRAVGTGWGSIKFLGFKNQTELPNYYGLCDVFVLPSLNEPWGLVVNEVMNAARPVIVSDQVGSGADLVRHGENGYVYKAGSVTDLTRCLRLVLDNKDRRVAMGHRSLELINSWSFEADLSGLREAILQP